jgi:hypothetical protein
LAARLTLYCACVDFLLKAAALCGVSYRDANAFLFFIAWPLVTVGLVIAAIARRRTR